MILLNDHIQTDVIFVLKSQYPWLPILKSKSFWALNVAAFINGGNNITNEILQRFLFDYSGSIAISQDMLTFRMSLLIIIITVIVCCIVDYIRNKNIITSSKVRWKYYKHYLYNLFCKSISNTRILSKTVEDIRVH